MTGARPGHATLVDGVLATAVLAGIALDALLGWWWADPVAGLVIVAYAVRDVGIFRGGQQAPAG